MKNTILYSKLILMFCCCFANFLSFAQDNKLIFAPHWLPQAQFAGFYVALDQGYYTDAGIDVQIIHPPAGISAFNFLKDGKADIVSSFLVDGIKQRASGTPLVNFAQLSQHSALMMVTKKVSGIEKPEDFQNKKLGIWSSGFDDIPIAYMRENNYSIELVRILNTINLFLMDGVDALTVMFYNEYDQIINSGINEDELNAFFFSDYGFDIPEDGLYCMESTYTLKKAALSKFVEATLKGWEFVAGHKEYTLDLVVKKMNEAHIPNNRAHQSWMIDRMLELIIPGEKNINKGCLLDKDYYRALEILKGDNPESFSHSNFSFDDFYKPVME